MGFRQLCPWSGQMAVAAPSVGFKLNFGLFHCKRIWLWTSTGLSTFPFRLQWYHASEESGENWLAKSKTGRFKGVFLTLVKCSWEFYGYSTLDFTTYRAVIITFLKWKVHKLLMDPNIPLVCLFFQLYYQTEPWIDSAGQPGGGVALHMQPWPRLETRGAKILIEISEACRRIITSARIKVFFSSMTSVPSWLHLVHVEKYLSLTDLELKTKRKHWSSDITKACFPKRTNTKTVIFYAIVFGQMLSGH